MLNPLRTTTGWLACGSTRCGWSARVGSGVVSSGWRYGRGGGWVVFGRGCWPGQVRLGRSRWFGDLFLGLELWKRLELDRFWEALLDGPEDAAEVPWSRIPALLAI